MTISIGTARPFQVTAVDTVATPLSSTPRKVLSVALRMPSTNTDAVVVGDADILSTDPGIGPDQTMSINVRDGVLIDLSKVYVRAASGSQAVDVFVIGS